MGSFSYFYYQLETAKGKPLKGNGYSAEEHVVGKSKSNNSNNRFVPLDKGQVARSKAAVICAEQDEAVPRSSRILR